MIDDCDYFIEKKGVNCDCYISSNGKATDFIYRKDTIKIADSEIHQYYFQSTEKSPVISDNLNLNEIYDKNLSKKSKAEIFNKYLLSYRWTGSYASDELTTLYMLTQVANWEEFKFSFRSWKSPCMNFVYADNSGNIGLLTAGSVPKRAEMNNMVLPNPGWLKEYDWYGLDTSGVIFSMFNPKKNYVYAANNSLIRDSKLSKYYDISSRARRIEELIKQYQTTENYIVGAVDIQRMQTDILSDYSRQLLDVVKPVIENNLNTLTELELKAYRILKNWDLLYSTKSNAPLIMNMFVKSLTEQVFKKELGSKAFGYYMSMPQFAMMKTFELLNEHYDTEKIDSLSVKEQTRIYTIMISFKSAVDSLKKIFGNRDIHNWQYGEYHNLSFKLPYRIFDFLKPVYKVDMMKIGGDISTINYSSWNYFEPFNVVSSVSMRLICDLSEQSVYYSLPGGVSEDPINPTFKSQLHLWENGANLKIIYNVGNLKGRMKILTLN
jgi:penicillin amidase